MKSWRGIGTRILASGDGWPKGDRTENEKAPPERARGIIRESQTRCFGASSLPSTNTS